MNMAVYITYKLCRGVTRKKYKCYIYNYEHTVTASSVCISRVTSPVTMTSLFITWKVIQTVSTAVADTLITISSVRTLCNKTFGRILCKHYPNMKPIFKKTKQIKTTHFI